MRHIFKVKGNSENKNKSKKEQRHREHSQKVVIDSLHRSCRYTRSSNHTYAEYNVECNIADKF